MIKLKTILIIPLLLLLTFPVVLKAQQVMRITQQDGTITDYHISEIRKLTFSGTATATREQITLVNNAIIQLNAYPNPTRNILNIDYKLPSEGIVDLEIYSLSGILVFKQKQGKLIPGEHRFKWSAGGYPSGQYIFRIRQNGKIASEKIIVNK